MEVCKIKTKEDWDLFLTQNNGSFLQSTDWGSFKQNFQKVWQIEARESNQIMGVCQIFEEKTPFGKYLYIPFGPCFKSSDARETIIKKVKEIAQEEGLSFIKIEPTLGVKEGVKSFKRVQPQKTLLVNINRDSHELLSSFSSSTRKNIALSKKKGVEIVEERDSDRLFNLLEKTKKRQNFNTYSKEYFSLLVKNTNSSVCCAIYKKEVISANIVYYFGSRATCLSSANDYNMRNLKGANLLRFRSFEIARDKGLKEFDQWGIDEVKYPGVSNFKKGFGGKEINYPETRDIVLKKTKYYSYKLASFIIKRK